MPKPVTGKTHVGERREKRPNGEIYVFERITAYNEKTQKTYTVSQKLKGKIKAGTQEIATCAGRFLKIQRPIENI